MMNAIKAEAEAGLWPIESDGQVSSPKQTADVEAAIARGVKGIIISPNEVDAMAPAIQQAIEAGSRWSPSTAACLGRGHPRPCRRRQRQGRRSPGQSDRLDVPRWCDDHQPAGPVRRLAGNRPQQGPAQCARRQGDKYKIVFEQTAGFDRAKGLSVTEAALRAWPSRRR